MKGKTVSRIILALLLTGMVTLVSNANTQPLETQPRTLIVDDDGPADLSSIQEAINAASPGDTIFVPSGTYYENVIVNKTVSLIGENKVTTTIDGNETGTVVAVTADDVEISGFTIRNGGKVYAGIIMSSNRNNITNNIMSNNWCGIRFEHNSVFNVIADNSIMNNLNGISGEFWSDTTIINNILKDNMMGINTNYCDRNTIAFNNITNHWSPGIMIQFSKFNTIVGNNITDNNLGEFNDWGGIYIGFSSHNKFFHNNIIANRVRQVEVRESLPYHPSANTWDDGYPSGGNYWSDHVCTGNPSNGSQPYVINEKNIDHYPFQDLNRWLGPEYILTVCTSPSGVTFTVDGETHTAPWSGTYIEGTSVSLDMPEIYTVEDAKYYWNQWSDGNTSRSRTVIITANITLTAYYTGPYHELTVKSSPMTGVTFTINGTPETTPYTEWLLEGSYTLEMPEMHDKSVWYHWIEDGDTNRIKTVILDTNILLTAVFAPPDITPPTVSIVSPENKTYPANKVPLTFTVSESTSWMSYSLDEQANITIAGNTTMIELSDGMHSLTVYAKDAAGNVGSSDIVYFTIDTTPPNISTMSPENKTYDTADIALTCTADGSAIWMAYSLDGQANMTITGDITLSGLSDGSHSLVVYAKDAVGNTGASGMVYFTVETQLSEPLPLWIIGTIVIIAGVGATFLIYFTKIRKTTERS